MFVVTNREVDDGEHSVKTFGEKLNAKGPNELRLARATRVAGKWRIDVLPDRVTPAMASDAGMVIDPIGPPFSSEYVARVLIDRIRSPGSGRGKNLLFLVHGFNNDMSAVLDRASLLEKNYGVEVFAFSWPANGGGARGVLDYKADKRDARASAGALDRVLGRMGELLDQENRRQIESFKEKARAKYPGHEEKQNAFVVQMSERHCPLTVNMMLHSMGNYLYKHVFASSLSNSRRLVFDNVLLVAADVNNEDHASWVEQIPARRRVYITINEKDAALQASRLKMGDAQKARLGHCRSGLVAKNAVYVDVTGAQHVEGSHAYFEGKAIENKKIRTFFRRAFNGEDADSNLIYDAATNLYRFTSARKAG